MNWLSEPIHTGQMKIDRLVGTDLSRPQRSICMYLVGIDVGTTNTKTVIFDSETGSIPAVGSSRTIVRHPTPEWSEFDAEDLWRTVLQSIQAAVQQCDHPERIRAIYVASMG